MKKEEMKAGNPKRPTLVIASHSGLTSLTRNTVDGLVRLGCAAYLEQGCADVALARNLALSVVLARAEEVGAKTLLLLDDDMVIEPSDALRLAAASERHEDAISAIYMTANGRLAAMPFGETGRYLTGLGCLALPTERLRGLAERSQEFSHDGRRAWAFCQTGIQKLGETKWEWVSEDFFFTIRLGGVRLAGIGAGHVKAVPLYPDATTIEEHGSALD